MKLFKDISILLINLFVFVSSVAITITFFIGGGEGNMQAMGAECFRYFTIDSNLLCGMGCLAYDVFYAIKMVKGTEIPKWVDLIKLSVTSAILLTFLTCVVFLGPTMGYAMIFTGRNFLLHALNPIAALLTFALLETRVLPKKFSIIGIVPTFVYSLAYVPCVVFAHVWPDFYGFTFGGHNWIVPFVLIIMYGVSWAIGLGLLVLNNLVTTKVHLK